jgi:hypothetical protein
MNEPTPVNRIPAIDFPRIIKGIIRSPVSLLLITLTPIAWAFDWGKKEQSFADYWESTMEFVLVR